MTSKSTLLTFTTGLALCALHCSADDTTLPNSTSGSSNNGVGQSNARGGTAGSVTGVAGSPAGTASSGGSAGLGAGGATGVASAGGSLSGGAGSGGSSGTVSAGAGAGAGGVGAAGGAGSGFSGSGIGAGSVSSWGGAGGMSGTGATTSGGSGSGMAGSGAAGAMTSTFAAVAEIIGGSCATSKCHPNDKGVHADLHNDDGKLYERLVATGATIPMAKDACKTLPLVVPGSPQTSLIMAMIVADDKDRTDCGDRMPYKCPDQMAQTVCLTDPQIETIRAWIAAGALP